MQLEPWNPGATTIGTLLRSLRYTLRVLAKSPVFATVAILSLALDIGANTAIFTLINALLLRDLPIRQPERLVELSLIRRDGQQVPFSYPMFREIERGQRVFSDLVGWSVGGMFNIEVNRSLSQSRVAEVTSNYYSELGVTALFGRLLTPGDVFPRSGATSQVAVINYEFWRRAFGGRRSCWETDSDRGPTLHHYRRNSKVVLRDDSR